LYLGTPGPHDPRYATKEFYDLYQDETMPLPSNFRSVHPFNNGEMTIRDEKLEKWPREPRAVQRHLHDYYSAISSMDYDFGRLFAALAELHLMENTIIIFCSDQGIAIGSHGLMGKQNLYESTMKVPLLFAGPDISPASPMP
jgi:arylsulfatase A-like enzyme